MHKEPDTCTPGNLDTSPNPVVPDAKHLACPKERKKTASSASRTRFLEAMEQILVVIP
jgi:hypothetical protein